MRYEAIILAGLVVLSGLAVAQPSENTDVSEKVRVQIDAPPVAEQGLKISEGVRHDFGTVFTTIVSEKRLERLKMLPRVEVSRVQRVSTLHHRDGHSRGGGRR